jgi:hypothetical protein
MLSRQERLRSPWRWVSCLCSSTVPQLGLHYLRLLVLGHFKTLVFAPTYGSYRGVVMLLTGGGEKLLATLEGWLLAHSRGLLLLVDHL